MSKRLAHLARGVKDLLIFHFLASSAIQFLFSPHFLDDTQVIEKKSGADKLSLRREKPLIRRQLERSILLSRSAVWCTMPNGDNSTAYWRRLVASITRRVQHACINHRGRRYRVAAISTVCLVAREPFCRRKPYQSEIRKGRNPRPAGRNRIPGVATLITECTHPEYDILFEARPICSCVQGMRIRGEYRVEPRVEWAEIRGIYSSLFLFLFWFGKIVYLGGYNWGWYDFIIYSFLIYR